MGRNLFAGQQMPAAPSTFEAAEHRYLAEGRDTSYRWAMSYDDFLAGVPYKENEVMLALCDGEARKAFILSTGYEKDSHGDRREKYRVLIANKTGDQFSKNWKWVFPRQVQDGYVAAGLAPDVPQ
jgi:hypothetical protein